MARHFRDIFVVAVSTVGSRFSGLLRDTVVFSLLGTGMIGSAFVTAFTIPNLFRRLLGEGALSSAMVPLFSASLEKSGRESAFRLLNQVLTWLALLLLAGTVWLAGAFFLLGSMPGGEPRWQAASGLGVVLAPYLTLVCLAAMVASALNTLGRFAIAALSQVWLNLAMVGCLGFGSLFFASTPEERVWWLCAGVLVGGACQLWLPWRELRREHWKPRLDTRRSPELRQVLVLFLPGVAGAAILQVNTAVSRFLAFSLDNHAASILYLANRLIELPIGVFATAITTVLFPVLSRLAAREEEAGFQRHYQQGLRLILAITCPAGVGLFLLGEPIVRVLFQYGAFREDDVAMTVQVLGIFALALPFYGFATLAVKALHARQDTKFPMRVAASNFLANVFFSVVLMQYWGMSGLALANLLANLLQCHLLDRELARREPPLGCHRQLRALGQIVVGCLGLAAVVWVGRLFLENWLGLSKGACLLQTVLLVPAGAGLYFMLLRLLQFEDGHELQGLVKRLLRRK